VRVGIDAPKGVPVHREEVYERNRLAELAGHDDSSKPLNAPPTIVTGAIDEGADGIGSDKG
jgi:hypothetical protein